MKISVGKQEARARYCVCAYFATEMKLKSAFHLSRMVPNIHFVFLPE